MLLRASDELLINRCAQTALGTLRRLAATLVPTTVSSDVLASIRLRNETNLVLWPLWLNLIRSLEVFSRVGDELRVAWMIDGLYPDNGAHQPGTVALNMFDQFGLCIGRPSDEDRTCICDGIRDRLQIGVILRSMSLPIEFALW
jgi:hypothetical protein